MVLPPPGFRSKKQKDDLKKALRAARDAMKAALKSPLIPHEVYEAASDAYQVALKAYRKYVR